jgi:hypothetical protein
MAVVHGARQVVTLLDRIVERLMLFWKAVIILSLVILCVFALDREPPFALLSAPNVSVRPGEWLKLTADVRRDADRGCEAVFSRYIFGEGGIRYDLGTSHASAQMISAMEMRDPGKLRVAVPVPSTIAPGPAWLEIVLSYRCNKVHSLVPIVVTVDIPFTVVE